MDSNTIINRKISNAGPLLPLYIPIIFTVLATAAASFLLFKYTDKTCIYTVFYNLVYSKIFPYFMANPYFIYNFNVNFRTKFNVSQW